MLALDQGTTSSRAVLIDRQGNLLHMDGSEFTQIYPRPGWVEHDPMEIWQTQLDAVRGVMRRAGASAGDIAAIGITNQRETTILWDRRTGKPVANAIVWQCRRTAETCDRLRAEGHAEAITERTGLVVDAYFSGTKVKWLLDSVPGLREAACRGDVLFGTVDSWLVWNLTGGRVHATDVSNASRTMLFNIHTLDWDDHILKLLDIPREMLPKVVASSGVLGYTDPDLLGGEIPIAGMAGDQQAALFGQACFTPGMVKNTYGTGCFMLMNTGTQPVRSRSNLLTTIAWQIGDVVEYGLEGSVFIAGAVVQWLRDGLRIIQSSAQSEELATSVPRHRRRVPGAGFHRAGGAVLGRLRPRHRGGADARHHARAHRARRPGEHSLPNPGRGGRHVRRQRHHPLGAACRRRSDSEQLPHAVPGRHPGGPPCAGRPWFRPLPWAPATWPGWAWAYGAARRSWQPTGNMMESSRQPWPKVSAAGCMRAGAGQSSARRPGWKARTTGRKG